MQKVIYATPYKNGVNPLPSGPSQALPASDIDAALALFPGVPVIQHLKKFAILDLGAGNRLALSFFRY